MPRLVLALEVTGLLLQHLGVELPRLAAEQLHPLVGRREAERLEVRVGGLLPVGGAGPWPDATLLQVVAGAVEPLHAVVAAGQGGGRRGLPAAAGAGAAWYSASNRLNSCRWAGVACGVRGRVGAVVVTVAVAGTAPDEASVLEPLVAMPPPSRLAVLAASLLSSDLLSLGFMMPLGST